MQTRRAILAGVAGLPFFGMAARAAATRNASLLLCRLTLDRSQIRHDGTVRLGASLEARVEHVRIFMPMRWGEMRGFRLAVRTPQKTIIEPRFHPPVALPPPLVTRGLGNYHELDVGEQIGFSAVVKARDIFPTTGRFQLKAIYVPEPPRSGAPIQAIVFENGRVESDSVAVAVV
jgi:hypothetical protein